MAKQFSPAERDVARRMAGSRKAPVDIWKKLKEMRAKRRLPAPDLTSVRRLLKCVTHRADAPESRGRKAKLGRAVVLRMNKVRKQITTKADGQCEIHWEDIRKKSRVPAVHPTTVARSFAREEIGVQWRAPRTRPLRGPEHEAERKEACRLWSKRPRHYFGWGWVGAVGCGWGGTPPCPTAPHAAHMAAQRSVNFRIFQPLRGPSHFLLHFHVLAFEARVPSLAVLALSRELLELGAVHVRELPVAEWQKLRAWCALKPLEQRRVIQWLS